MASVGFKTASATGLKSQATNQSRREELPQLPRGLTISDPPTQAEVQALRDKCEELADDVRNLLMLVHSLRTGLVSRGVVKGST